MIIALLAVLGLIIGSFISAVTWRLKSGESITRGRSMCPNCKHKLGPLDLIPLLSWLTLRGKCRYCGKAYGSHYVLVEVGTAILFALSGVFLQLGAVLMVLWLLILTCLMILALYDAQWYELPNKVMHPTIVLAFIYFVLQFKAPESLYQLLTAAVAATVFYAAWWLSNGRLMGGADSKLVLAMGLILAPQQLGLALAIGFMLGGVGAAVLLVGKKKGMSDQIPFGPYLIAGLVIAQLFL